MKYALIFLAIISIATTANAETKITVEKEFETLCRDQVVGANYVGGVDVNGNSVVPADLNSSGSDILPEVIEIPVTMELAQKLNLSIAGLELKPELGKISVTKNGKVTFNGRDISSNVTTFCKDASASNTFSAPLELVPDNRPQTSKFMGQPNADAPTNVPLQSDQLPLPATVSPSVTKTIQ
jgi:hypothetical protein